MTTLNSLERLGFCVATAQLMELTAGHGRLLLALIEADGEPLSAEDLGRRVKFKGRHLNARSVIVYACHLREALADLGLPTLKSQQGRGPTYRLDPIEAAQILDSISKGVVDGV